MDSRRSNIFRHSANRLIAFLLVMVFGFVAMRVLPGDPVLLYLPSQDKGRFSEGRAPDKMQKEYLQTARKYGLDKPMFYFSITPSNRMPELQNPDSLYLNPARKNFLRRYTHPEAYALLLILEKKRISSLPSELEYWTQAWQNPEKYIAQNMQKDKQILSDLSGTPLPTNIWKSFLPRWIWHGANNQFNNWVMGIVKGDWGVSIKDQQPVWSRLKKALFWTLSIQIPALIIAALSAIVLGVWFARRKGTPAVQLVITLLQTVYAIPLFVSAFILLSLFSGMGLYAEQFQPAGMSVIAHLKTICLPIVCLVLPSLAVLANQVYYTVLAETQKPYASYLWLRGISKQVAFNKYFLKNALVPLSAEIGRIIPALIGGSLLVEIVFNLPGMGRLLAESIYARDWPVLQGVLLLSAIVSIIGVAVSDLMLSGLVNKLRIHET